MVAAHYGKHHVSVEEMCGIGVIKAIHESSTVYLDGLYLFLARKGIDTPQLGQCRASKRIIQ